MKTKISISAILNYFSFLPSVQNGGSSRGAPRRSWGPGPHGGAKRPGPCLFWVKKKKSQKKKLTRKAKQNHPTLPPPTPFSSRSRLATEQILFHT